LEATGRCVIFASQWIQGNLGSGNGERKMILTRNQIMLMYLALDKYPNAQYIVIRDEANGSGIGPNTIAQFQDRGNLFKMISPKVLGEEDITDVDLW
jgi:hypothetical protein